MRIIFLFTVLLTSVIFFACSSDSLNDEESFGVCKTCDDFTDSEAKVEICDNGNNTATVIVFLSGLSLPRQIIEIDSDTFYEFDCNNLEALNIDFDL